MCKHIRYGTITPTLCTYCVVHTVYALPALYTVCIPYNGVPVLVRTSTAAAKYSIHCILYIMYTERRKEGIAHTVLCMYSAVQSTVEYTVRLYTQ